MGLEDGRKHTAKDRLIPERSTSMVLGGVHFREISPNESLPDLQPMQYVAVGLTDRTQLNPADFDRFTGAVAGDEKRALKFIVTDQLDPKDLNTPRPVLLVFSSTHEHLSVIEALAASRFLMGEEHAAGFMQRTEGPEGASYAFFGNSLSLGNTLPLEKSNKYRDKELIPALKEAGVRIGD